MFHKNTLGTQTNNKPKYSLAQKIFSVLLVIACIVGVGYSGKFLVIKAQAAMGYLSENTIDIVSNTFGSPMQKDIYGNINILIVGIGGENHDGGMLADAIIVAAWNPKTQSVTMISIPRDLYVEIPSSNSKGRINQVFSHAYYNNDRDLTRAAQILATEIEEITGINPQYSIVMDFNGFKNVIDAIGGIDIYVPERIYDTTYPNDANRGYTTFHIERGDHHIDGTTALKYARSRHSSSDFARSARQQQIIEATIRAILRKENIQNVATIKQLYEEYSKMVTTNISNKEIIGMIKYVFSLKHIFNFGLTSTCSHRGWQVMQPGCFLHTPNRDWFGGASVLLTNGSKYNDLGFYDYTRNFGHIVSQNQGFLIENAQIQIANGIDTSYAKQANKGTDGHATQIATKLRKYGFSIVGVANAPSTQTGTTVLISGTGNYTQTISVLEKFFPIAEVIQGQIQTGVDLIITLGNDYIDFRPTSFNYDI